MGVPDSIVGLIYLPWCTETTLETSWRGRVHRIAVFVTINRCHLLRRMWMASAFCQLSSAAAASVASTSCSLLSQTLIPKTLAFSCCKRLGRPATGCGRLFTAAFSTKRGDSSRAGSMIPEDVASLMEAVYAAKPTPQICLTTTG